MRSLSVSDPDSEHALLDLKAKQPAVGDAQGGAARFGEVSGQHGLGAMPCPRAATKLTDVVEARTCAHRKGKKCQYSFAL